LMQAMIIITLKTYIKPELEIKPPFVYWQNGEEPKQKKISVKAAKEFPAKEITIKSNSQNFESKVEPGKAGEWTIEVTPKDTSHPMGTALQIQTDYPKEAPKSIYLNVVVTTPPGLPPAASPNDANPPASRTATPAEMPPAA